MILVDDESVPEGGSFDYKAAPKLILIIFTAKRPAGNNESLQAGIPVRTWNISY